jgi:hypothetical protein
MKDTLSSTQRNSTSARLARLFNKGHTRRKSLGALRVNNYLLGVGLRDRVDSLNERSRKPSPFRPVGRTLILSSHVRMSQLSG